MASSPPSTILILTGPTAVGKTHLSLTLARILDADIISADSRQIYKELNLGTAKPSPEERSSITHHFIDELTITQPYSAGQFAEDARQRIKQLINKGATPIIIGGSTLYIHALQTGLPPLPQSDPDLREALSRRLKKEGASALYQELLTVDPIFARTLDPTKTQRLLRGLEVYYLSGKPLSSYATPAPNEEIRFRTVVLYRDRKRLYKRINRRVDQMIEAGLLDEVSALHEQGYDERINALNTIGYKEPLAYLRREISYDEMVRLIKRNTRRYAKRQLTWFRRFPDYEWIDLDQTSEEELVRYLVMHQASERDL